MKIKNMKSRSSRIREIGSDQAIKNIKNTIEKIKIENIFYFYF